MSTGGHDDDEYSRPDFLGEKNDEFNSTIMVTAVITLATVIFVVVILRLYAKYVTRHQARRRAAIGQLGLSVAQAPSNEPPRRTGLDPAMIVTLPSFAFKSQHFGHQDRKDAGIECAVCLSSLEDGDMARLLPNCKHIFHLQCIDKWLVANSTCPICRTMAEPRIKPEPREGPVIGLVGGDINESSTTPVPTFDVMNDSSMGPFDESTSDGVAAKMINGSNSRLSSFRRMLSRERSSRRIEPRSQGAMEDLERQ